MCSDVAIGSGGCDRNRSILVSVVGEHGLGEFARAQLDQARADPRLGRGPAAVADFFVGLEEAERTRFLFICGIHEMSRPTEREAGDDVGRQAAWERAELAIAERDNDFPHINASTAASLAHLLDGFIEELTPSVRAVQLSESVEHVLAEAARKHPVLADHDLLTDRRDVLRHVVLEALDEALPRLKPLEGVGVARYERRLRRVGLGAADDRPSPDDLDATLQELHVARAAMAHRAGRVSERDAQLCPTLPWGVGDLIRIGSARFREYDAAVRCYGLEVQRRLLLHAGLGTPVEVELDRWREYASVTQ